MVHCQQRVVPRPSGHEELWLTIDDFCLVAFWLTTPVLSCKRSSGSSLDAAMFFWLPRIWRLVWRVGASRMHFQALYIWSSRHILQAFEHLRYSGTREQTQLSMSSSSNISFA